MSRRRWNRGWALALAGCVCLAATGFAVYPRHDGDAPRGARAAALRARSAVLRERLAMAASDSLLLILDPDRATLALARGGATLREWPVAGVSAGRRRLGFGRGGDRSDWRTRVWSTARVDPPLSRDRRVIVSDDVTPPDLTGAVDWIPPTPDEAVPTPPRFLVHYADGLGVEVVALGPEGSHRPRGLLRRLVLAAREMLPVSWDRYRVRVLMPAAAAGALYRSFPAGAAFVAVLPEP
jgi:hypothetical protein